MSNNNQQGEPAFLLLMVIVLLGGLGWIIWYCTHDFWLQYVLRWLRYAEVWVVNLFTQRYGACLDWLRYAQIQSVPQRLEMSDLTPRCFGNYLLTLPPQELGSYYVLSLPPLTAMGAMTAGYFRWPIAAALAAITVYLLLFSPRTKFRTKHTLESFIQVQAKMWPIISPIVKFNPTKSGRMIGDPVPDKLPLFAEALSPEEWISWNRIPVVNGIPDRDAARRAFTQQLGPRWNGPDSLPKHIQALLVGFALRGTQKRDDCDKLMGRLAEAWSPEKGLQMGADLTGEISKLLHDPKVVGKALAIADQHAWRTTAILGVLRWARAQGGVLAPAQFLWLRAEDRALWYPLNNLGRRAFHSEGAGAMAHFMAEQAAQKPLPIPRVETAIVTLNTYLHDPEKKPVTVPPREGSVK